MYHSVTCDLRRITRRVGREVQGQDGMLACIKSAHLPKVTAYRVDFIWNCSPQKMCLLWGGCTYRMLHLSQLVGLT